jgi:hypothetical protein
MLIVLSDGQRMILTYGPPVKCLLRAGAVETMAVLQLSIQTSQTMLAGSIKQGRKVCIATSVHDPQT